MYKSYLISGGNGAGSLLCSAGIFQYISLFAMEPHGDDLVVCPYCLAPRDHTVKFKTLASHLEKIKKSNPELRKRKTCRFNIMHLIPKDELEQHHAVCPDRRMDMFIPSDETLSPLDDSSALPDTMEDEPSSPQHSTSTFRLNINVHRPIGGYRRRVPSPEPEGPRLPVGMAPRIQALPSRTTSRQSARNAVSECKAFNKAHLC